MVDVDRDRLLAMARPDIFISRESRRISRAWFIGNLVFGIRIPPDLGDSEHHQSEEYGVHARETTREKANGNGCSPWRESLFAMERTGDRDREITRSPSKRMSDRVQGESPFAIGENMHFI